MQPGRIAIIGDGAWATAIAQLLCARNSVTLWGRSPEYIAEMQASRRNTRYLQGHPLPEALRLTAVMPEAVDGADYIVLASPTQYARKSLERLSESGFHSRQILINLSKGIEVGTLHRISTICAEVLGSIRYAVLSGPSHAEEVVLSVPTAVVVASSDPVIAKQVQDLFMGDDFRVYRSDDVVGVELGGALKNVFAIAAGICDGMGLGDNSKAALITRGIAEMARLGTTLGGRQETFAGLSGVGDMIVTCMSRHSRNRFVGENLGKGLPLDAIVARMGTVVAEGIKTTTSAFELAKLHRVETPIINEVHAGLYEGKDCRQGLTDLMRRKAKSEND